MYERLKLATIILLAAGFATAGAAATNGSVTDELTESMYWLQKPAWDDRPSYAENISIQYSPTDLIQKRETREVCTEYGNETNSTTGLRNCLSYENQTFAGESVPIFDIQSGENAYLGDGHVRTNLSIGLNELSTKTLKQTTLLLSESDYIDWFNERYYYNGRNITSSDVGALEDRLFSMSARGQNTNLLASRFNSLKVDSVSPFRASANTTMVFRFEDFRSGSFVLSDLMRVEVASGIGT
jgi:hypothetical protein